MFISDQLTTHKNESYNECGYWGRDLENMKDLRRHLIIIHVNYPCSICEDISISYQTLHMHMLHQIEM